MLEKLQYAFSYNSLVPHLRTHRNAAFSITKKITKGKKPHPRISSPTHTLRTRVFTILPQITTEAYDRVCSPFVWYHTHTHKQTRPEKKKKNSCFRQVTAVISVCIETFPYFITVNIKVKTL